MPLLLFPLNQRNEANPHFLGRFQQALFARVRYSDAGDVPSVAAVVETNPHWLGRFTPTAFARFHPSQGAEADAPIVETQPHWLGRFQPIAFRLLPATWQSPNTDFIVAGVQPETNTHWLGRFTPTIFNARALNSGAEADAPIVETNPHWLGHFTGAAYKARAVTSGAESDQTETPPHWLGRFHETKFNRLALLLQATANDSIVVPEEALEGLAYLGRFQAQRFPLLQALRTTMMISGSGPPSPPPVGGVFTVSGPDVIDLFDPHVGVVYTLSPTQRRTA